MARCKALALSLLCAAPLLFVTSVKRTALRAVEEESKLDPVAGAEIHLKNSLDGRFREGLAPILGAVEVKQVARWR